MRRRPLSFFFLVLIALFFFRLDSAASANSVTAPVTPQEASRIARSFAAFNAAGHFPAWQNAGQFVAEKVFSSDGVLVSYEVSVKSELGDALGFVVVAAQKGNGEVVTAFSDEGQSKASALKSYVSTQLEPFFNKQGLKASSQRLIGSAIGAYAIGLKFDRSIPALSDAHREGGYYLFSDLPGMRNLSFTYRDKESLKRKTPEDAQYNEEIELRRALLAGDFSSVLFHEESSAKIEGLEKGSGSISGTFSLLYQEKRAWTKGTLTNGTCYAGCTPAAWTILLEYWDRNGYAKLISTAEDNSNTSTTDPDIRWTINELRGTLVTTCTSAGEGSTSYANAPKGASYAKSRGYSNSSASNTSILWSAWWDLLSAVGSGKPPIAALDTNSDRLMDHSAVVFSYIDNWGTANDSYCFRTGWQTSPSLCYTTQNALYGLTSVTVK